ncbi:MAG: hypothetical protein WKF96_19195, partial [Solirubrobacteraceae bacterium]
PGLVEETVTLPVFVNVVPGDEAAGRTANPKVRQELLFQQAQKSKRDAMDDLARGDITGAAMTLRDAAGVLPPLHDKERDVLLSMAVEAEQDDAGRARKRMAADAASKSRRRGREE